MNQEHEKNHPIAVDNKISLWEVPPRDCCRKYLLKLAYNELDMTVKLVFIQIRSIAWEEDGEPMKRLHEIGVIADAFHNWGANPPHELVKAKLADCSSCSHCAITMIIRKRFVSSICG